MDAYSDEHPGAAGQGGASGSGPSVAGTEALAAFWLRHASLTDARACRLAVAGQSQRVEGLRRHAARMRRVAAAALQRRLSADGE